MSIAKTLYKLRIENRQSIQDVADAVNVSKTHIWELEKGRAKNPTLELLSKLANHFDVSIRHLVEENFEPPNDEKLISMFRRAGKLNDSDKSILDGMIQLMLDQKDKK